MSWDLKFLDTFTRYNVLLGSGVPLGATGTGKWTIQTLGALFSTASVEDGMQTASIGGGNNWKKTVSSMNRGAICGTRFQTEDSSVNLQPIIIEDSTITSRYGLIYLGASGRWRVNLPLGGTVDSDLGEGVTPNNTLVNAEGSVWFDGATVHWETRIDGVVRPSLTGTAVSALTPTINSVGIGRGSFYHWFWAKGYSGSGGKWTTPAGTDFLGNCKRGVMDPNADGQYPATQVGARWIPNSGTNYHSRLSEALADTATYASNIVDANSSPAAVDRMSVSLSDPPASLVNVKAVQAAVLSCMESGSGTARIFYGTTGAAGDTFDGTNFSPASTYIYELRPLLLDPRDSGGWTRARLATLDIGLELRDLV